MHTLILGACMHGAHPPASQREEGMGSRNGSPIAVAALEPFSSDTKGYTKDLPDFGLLV